MQRLRLSLPSKPHGQLAPYEATGVTREDGSQAEFEGASLIPQTWLRVEALGRRA